MIIVGDIHGKWNHLNDICQKHSNKIVLGLGDIGLGFHGCPDPVLPPNFRFFRGNHDNPSCVNHPQYTTDYGMWKDIFIVAGANSVDSQWRTEGRDWWRNEQLSPSQMESALEQYKIAKPSIVVCHEAPFRLHNLQHAASLTHNPNNNWGNPRGNNTAFLLDAMLDYHMPLLLIHGHWHNPLVYKQWGCTFVSLGELETFDLDVAKTRT